MVGAGGVTQWVMGGGSHSRCWEGIAQWVLGEGHTVGAGRGSHGVCWEGLTWWVLRVTPVLELGSTEHY